MSDRELDPAQLAEDLLKTNARGLKWHLLRIDRKRHLVYFRNMQHNGLWQTRYILPAKGFQVTLDEELAMQPNVRPHTRRAQYRTAAVRVERLT
ncbi:MAG: hypothetical protein OXF22_07880 [Anaerolineaceae bacterium]|nr:hypothetical protein [Chloroflexota bacterium]MCY4009649.1 hypothetical protein [Anaerolineaceae bacterium]